MSLSTEEIAALEALSTRFEQVTGRPCDLLSRMVLTYAARDLVAGFCISLRPSGPGVVVVRLRRPSLATWLKAKSEIGPGWVHGPEDADGKQIHP